jgi:protease I
VPVEVPLNSADPSRHDALLLPGGVKNPDTLRMNPDAMRFAKHFFDAGKPVAAICHGLWTVVETTLTSWPSLNTDIRNAGGNMGGQRSRYG